MQAADGAEVNQVYLLFGQLEVTAIRNGDRDHGLLRTTAHQRRGSSCRDAPGRGRTPPSRLANRSSFIERLNGHFSSAERRLETLNVLFVDIDDFKLVNDTLGHSAGDALLVGVAKRLSACVRPYDYIARLGGDEFAIIALEAPGDRRPAESVAQRILTAFKDPLSIGDRLVSVAVSIGVSTARTGAVDGSGLLSEADFAMYTAKRAGKGRHEFLDPTAEARPPVLVNPVA